MADKYFGQNYWETGDTGTGLYIIGAEEKCPYLLPCGAKPCEKVGRCPAEVGSPEGCDEMDINRVVTWRFG